MNFLNFNSFLDHLVVDKFLVIFLEIIITKTKLFVNMFKNVLSKLEPRKPIWEARPPSK